MAEITIETKVRGEWTRYAPACVQCDDPENMLHEACKAVGEMIADNHFPGTEVRATWTDEDGMPATLLSNDPLLDEYIVDARENQRQYAEAQRHLFRNAS